MHIQLVSLFIAAHFVNDIIHRRLINSNVLSGRHCGGVWRCGGGGGYICTCSIISVLLLCTKTEIQQHVHVLSCMFTSGLN